MAGAEDEDAKTNKEALGRGRESEEMGACYRTVLPGVLARRVTNPRPSFACSSPPPPNSLESWCLRRPSFGLSQVYSRGVIWGPRVGLILKGERVDKQGPGLSQQKLLRWPLLLAIRNLGRGARIWRSPSLHRLQSLTF